MVVERLEEVRVPAGEVGGEAGLLLPDERGRVVREDRVQGDGSRRRHAHVPPLVLARSGSTGPGGRTARLSPSAQAVAWAGRPAWFAPTLARTTWLRQPSPRCGNRVVATTSWSRHDHEHAGRADRPPPVPVHEHGRRHAARGRPRAHDLVLHGRVRPRPAQGAVARRGGAPCAGPRPHTHAAPRAYARAAARRPAPGRPVPHGLPVRRRPEPRRDRLPRRAGPPGHLRRVERPPRQRGVLLHRPRGQRRRALHRPPPARRGCASTARSS